MLVILTVFFYLHGRVALSSMDCADDGLPMAGSEVQIPPEPPVFNGRDPADEFINYVFVDLWPGEVEDFIKGFLDRRHIERSCFIVAGGIQLFQLGFQYCEVILCLFSLALKLLL